MKTDIDQTFTREEWRDAWNLIRRNLWHPWGRDKACSKLASECLIARRSADYPFAPMSQRLLDWQFNKNNK